MDSLTEKAGLRRTLLTTRRAWSPENRQAASQKILHRLVSLPQWRTAKHIGCYVSLADEVYTRELINYAKATGKQIAAPVIHPIEHQLYFCLINAFSELTPGRLGILEPKLVDPLPREWFDLCIIPGIGFDLHGNRLGFGKGYYDQFLSQVKAIKLALAFDWQILENLPVSTHDIPMDLIVTESRTLYPV